MIEKRGVTEDEVDLAPVGWKGARPEKQAAQVGPPPVVCGDDPLSKLADEVKKTAVKS